MVHEREWASSTNCGRVNYMGLDKIGIMLWYHFLAKEDNCTRKEN